jgi:hypothetical protein
MPKDIGCDIEKNSFAKIKIVKHCLKYYVDEMIKRHLKSHILDEIINSAVSKCHN